jgi:hypothetical protein
MNFNKKKLLKLLAFILLVAGLGFFVAEKINLATTDLGRHLKNGEIILNNHGDFQKALNTNFYSYTEPDFPFVNHHWGSGVVFYGIQRIFGFSGLSWLYILLTLGSFSLFFFNLVKKHNFWLVALLTFFLLPLMAERREIRPEVFSLFFSVMFFILLWNFSMGKIKAKWLWMMPILMLFWANLHVYFVLGFIFLALFFLENLLKDFSLKNFASSKNIFFVGLVSFLVSFLNPLGAKTVFYPLKIFQNYGYSVLENQTVFFVKDYGLQNPNYNLTILVFIIIISLVVFNIWKNRRENLAINLSGLFFAVWGISAVRNFTLLGFFALPVLVLGLRNLFWERDKIKQPDFLAVSLIGIFLLGVYFNYQFLSFYGGKQGIGLQAGNEKAAQFFREHNLPGPIFNNYDIGSYLIYNLYPQEKVFVDNRPEAYSVDFFQKTYIPMQSDEKVWQEKLAKYNFQTIFFTVSDITPWGKFFLESRLDDPVWKIVYQDNYAIIFGRK